MSEREDAQVGVDSQIEGAESTDEVIDLEDFETKDGAESTEEDGRAPNDNLLELEFDPEWSQEDAKANWDKRTEGLKKLRSEAEETAKRAAIFLEHEDDWKQLASNAAALYNRDHSTKPLAELVGALKQYHGWSDADVSKALGFTQGEEENIEFKDDADLIRHAKAEALKEFEAKYGGKLSDIEAAEAQRAERSRFDEFLDKNHASITKQVSDMAGTKLKFSRGQVEAAMKAEPEIAKKDPAKAVFVHYSSLIRKAMAGKARGESKRGPEMIKTSQRSGSTKKADAEKSWSELARERGIDPVQAVNDMFG